MPSVVFAALLVLVAVLFVISNTMRLAIHARAQEIEIMQWVGASSFYIRLPFYVEGGIQGFCAGILALVSARIVVGSAIFLLPTFPDDFQQIDLAKLSTSFEVTLTIGLRCFWGFWQATWRQVDTSSRSRAVGFK